MLEYIKNLCTLNRCKYFDPKFKLLLQSAFYAYNRLSVISIVFGDAKFTFLQ